MRTITLIHSGTKLAFTTNEDIIYEEIMESLFEKCEIDPKTARWLAFNTKEPGLVLNVIRYHSDQFTSKDIYELYKIHKNDINVCGEICLLKQTPTIVLMKLTEHPDSSISELALEKLKSRRK